MKWIANLLSKVPFLKKWAIKLLFNYLDKQSEKVDHPVLSDLINDNFGRAKTIVLFLNDKDPNDAKQFQEFFKEHRKDIVCDTVDSLEMTGKMYLEKSHYNRYIKSLVEQIKQKNDCPE